VILLIEVYTMRMGCIVASLVVLASCGTDDKNEIDWRNPSNRSHESGDDDSTEADTPDTDTADTDTPDTDTPDTDTPVLSLIGTECDGGGVFDCELECWVADARAYIGDGQCDDGARGPVFDCVEMNFDEGDCEDEGGASDLPPATDGGGSGGSGDGAGTGGGTGSGDGAGTGGGTGSGDGGGTGGGTSGGTTGGGTGVADEGADCTTEMGIALADETGATILELPAGSAGQLDCSGECIATELIEGFESGGVMYAGSLGNGICDDGTGPEGYLFPNFDCEAWSFDGGDCP
jgi:hypothetical protein